MNELTHNLYKAYHYFLRGEPFPVDLTVTLLELQIDPSELEERFHHGSFPMGAEVIDPEEDPEETSYEELPGDIQELLDSLRQTNQILTRFFKPKGDMN